MRGAEDHRAEEGERVKGINYEVMPVGGGAKEVNRVKECKRDLFLFFFQQPFIKDSLFGCMDLDYAITAVRIRYHHQHHYKEEKEGEGEGEEEEKKKKMNISIIKEEEEEEEKEVEGEGRRKRSRKKMRTKTK